MVLRFPDRFRFVPGVPNFTGTLRRGVFIKKPKFRLFRFNFRFWRNLKHRLSLKVWKVPVNGSLGTHEYFANTRGSTQHLGTGCRCRCNRKPTYKNLKPNRVLETHVKTSTCLGSQSQNFYTTYCRLFIFSGNIVKYVVNMCSKYYLIILNIS